LLLFPLIHAAPSTSSARSLSSISGSGLRNPISSAGQVPASRVASSPLALNLVLKASICIPCKSLGFNLPCSVPSSYQVVKIACAHARVRSDNGLQDNQNK
ncbi:hypothetical protein C8R45DRAFT_1080649, partial [Mycena sanguinolenta]